MHIPFLIIGAGPAGLMAGISFGKGAVILERNPYAGKKLLISGSGQCNITNALEIPEFLKECKPYARFLKPALYALDNKRVIQMLESAGCPCMIREDGKVFPRSLISSSVREALITLAKQNGVRIIYNSSVKEIGIMTGSEAKSQENVFIIKTRQHDFFANKILLATGGKSYPKTGSDGLGYYFARQLEHNIIEPRPALVGVDIVDFDIWMSCSGASIAAETITIVSIEKRTRVKGQILFTHKGLSGPGIINNSHLMDQGCLIELCLLADPEKKLMDMEINQAHKKVCNGLKQYNIPECISRALILASGLDPDLRFADLNKTRRKLLGNKLENLGFIVKQVEGWNKAMTTAGGINLSEVNPKTMESRLHNNLYLAGEILDYTLPTGGFNIQAALSTGYLSGLSAKNAAR